MSEPLRPRRVLLLGTTGYIGGAVIDHLIKSPDPLFAACAITALVRGENRVTKLKELYGDRVAPIIFSGLEDTEFLSRIASEHDIVVNAGTGFHAPSAESLVRGLAQRLKDPRNPEPWIIHLSGGSNVMYVPLDSDPCPDKRPSLDDADPEAIYNQEKALEALVPYPQRTAELAVWAATRETGVHAVALQAPYVFGEGPPHFGAAPRGIAIMMQFVLDKGYAFQLGDGKGRLAVGHVDDVADFFLLLLHEMVKDGGQILLRHKVRILYPNVGMAESAVAANKCLDAASRKGLLPKISGEQPKEVRIVDLEEAGPYFGLGGIHGKTVAALCWGKSVDTIGTVGKDLLGWKPRYLMEDWASDQHFDDELEAMLAGKRHTPTIRSATTIPPVGRLD